MKIYIDETGIFANPNKNENLVSCVGALVIPEILHGNVIREFEKVLRNWPFDEDEIKGSQLNEDQINQLINKLIDFDIFFQVCAIDLGIRNEDQIINHKNTQADRLIEKIDSRYHSKLIEQLHDLRARLKELSNPLYVQLICLTEAVYDVIKIVTLYYCQRIPTTLGNFSWTIDRKNKTLTEYENLWKYLVLPIIQTKSITDPVVMFPKGNYDSFSKYENPENTPPEYLKPYLKEPTERFYSIDANKLIMEDLKFSDSKDHRGLQLVDILVTNVRRAFQGNLKIKGWCNIGKLMVQAKRGSNSIRMISLGNIEIKKPLPYNLLIKITDDSAKQMILPKFFSS